MHCEDSISFVCDVNFTVEMLTRKNLEASPCKIGKSRIQITADPKIILNKFDEKQI